MRFGPTLMQQSEDLARFSSSATELTRTYLTSEHKQAGDYLLKLMRDAGMSADYDAVGNVVGRYAGLTVDAPIILTGSHMDSVVNAGKYDGLYGILTAIACVADLHARGKRLAHAIEIVAFCDEEGVRFGVTMIGSAAMSGRFDDTWLAKIDAEGVTMREALTRFGGQPDDYASVKRDFAAGQGSNRIACFVESHIEQGPVLLNEGLPVGVVTAIAGASRIKVGVTGLAGHAGTVPMPLRQDALTAAAEMTLAIERIALSRADRIVATVGRFNVAGGGAINVIPGDVAFTIDLRSGDDAVRRETLLLLEQACRDIAERRKVKIDWNPFFELPAAPCNSTLQTQLAAAIATQGIPVRYLPSGAGHDAMEFAALVPTAMLFVRCGNGGISHNPLETMTAEDAEISTRVLLHFFENFSSVRG